MPRAITKEDIKRIRAYYELSLTIKPHEKLGYIVRVNDDVYAYQVFESRYGGTLLLNFVSKKTIDLRKRIGPAKKRIKQILKDPDFGLEEMALAEAMINGGRNEGT